MLEIESAPLSEDEDEFKKWIIYEWMHVDYLQSSSLWAALCCHTVQSFHAVTQCCIAKNGGGYTQTGVAKGLKVPCFFMITEVSIRCQNKPGGWYTPYTRLYPPIHHCCYIVECAADTAMGFSRSVTPGCVKHVRVKNQWTEKPAACRNRSWDRRNGYCKFFLSLLVLRNWCTDMVTLNYLSLSCKPANSGLPVELLSTFSVGLH